MTRTAVLGPIGWIALAVAATTGSVAVAAPTETDLADESPLEARCWELIDALDALLAADSLSAPPPGIAERAESEALRAVGEDLLAEGDSETAATLLAEALAVWPRSPPPDD